MLIRNSQHDIGDEIDCGLHGKMLQFDDFKRALSSIVVKIEKSEVPNEFGLN